MGKMKINQQNRQKSNWKNDVYSGSIVDYQTISYHFSNSNKQLLRLSELIQLLYDTYIL